MTYPPPYDPDNDPLRKRDDVPGEQGATPDPAAGPQHPGPQYPGYQSPGHPQPGYQQPVPQPPGYPQPGYGYQQPGYPAGGYGYPVNRVTNSNAIVALVCGIAAFVICGLSAIPAIIFGNRAITEIDASGGAQDGRGLAQAGRIIGWVAIAMWAIGLVLFVIILIAAAATSSS